MDTYSIEPDYHEGYQARVVRGNGIAHSAHGFASRCDAQKWLSQASADHPRYREPGVDLMSKRHPRMRGDEQGDV